ncbi:MAG: hypothetical protein K8F91_08185 [Candidatus Obscuribacterales bacterium]|nr:hypothetical protein [Candidatus Obscuribacterales bacterium]
MKTSVRQKIDFERISTGLVNLYATRLHLDNAKAFSSYDYIRARDYVDKGALSTATKIKDNTSTINDNEEAIEQAISDMSPDERRLYQAGRQLKAGRVEKGLTPEQEIKARKVYTDMEIVMPGADNLPKIVRQLR